VRALAAAALAACSDKDANGSRGGRSKQASPYAVRSYVRNNGLFCPNGNSSCVALSVGGDSFHARLGGLPAWPMTSVRRFRGACRARMQFGSRRNCVARRCRPACWARLRQQRQPRQRRHGQHHQHRRRSRRRRSHRRRSRRRRRSLRHPRQGRYRHRDRHRLRSRHRLRGRDRHRGRYRQLGTRFRPARIRAMHCRSACRVPVRSARRHPRYGGGGCRWGECRRSCGTWAPRRQPARTLRRHRPRASRSRTFEPRLRTSRRRPPRQRRPSLRALRPQPPRQRRPSLRALRPRQRPPHAPRPQSPRHRPPAQGTSIHGRHRRAVRCATSQGGASCSRGGG
jgi:hypothetical protein